MQRIRQDEDNQVVTMAMVAAIANMGVDLLQIGCRWHIRFEQHVSIGAAWASGCAMFEIHAIRANTWEGRDYGAIDRVGMPLVDR
ncbi:hypothetical protein D3C76_1294270 [compost metagenome]